jgi:hypothetical protein
MAKKSKKDRANEDSQRQWAEEDARIQRFRSLAPGMKAELRKLGCNLPFYEWLDSYEAEFAKIVTWGKAEFHTLYDVFEVGKGKLDRQLGWRTLGLPADWSHLRIAFDDEAVQSYILPDDNACLRGSTTLFRDSAGLLRSVVRVIKNPEFTAKHKDYRYSLKLPILLHELGHVNDYEKKINLDVDSRSGDLIEAEVYANLFALNECFRRAYYLSGNTLLEALAGYKNALDYRGVVANRVFERFQKPAYRPWTDYDLAQ